MIQQIDHIAIAVTDLEAASQQYQLLLGVSPNPVERVDDQGVDVVCFCLADQRIELISPIDSDNSIAGFLKKRGDGIHHVAFRVDNIVDAICKYQQKGFRMIHDTPQPGADNCMVAFMHPKSASGVLVELIEHK